MKKIRNTQVDVAGSDYPELNDLDNVSYLSDEMVAMFVDGDLSSHDRERVLNIISKNHELRRKVSDYVKLKRFENPHSEDSRKEASTTITLSNDSTDINTDNNNDIIQQDFSFDEDSFKDFDSPQFFKEQVPASWTKKAFALYKKSMKPKTVKTNQTTVFEPVYINHSESEYEITGIIHHIKSTKKNLELHITKNGKPYKGEIYLYKGDILYKKIKPIKDSITCDLANSGSYHIYIKDGEIKSATLDLEFEVL
jgi:hypothetical protein